MQSPPVIDTPLFTRELTGGTVFDSETAKDTILQSIDNDPTYACTGNRENK